MRMTKLEKRFVNSARHARANIKVAERMLDQMELNNNPSVLEVGCGFGHLAAYLHDKYGFKIIGIDVDPEQIDLAKRNHEETNALKFLTANITNLPFEGSEFDLVLSFKVMHHIPDWERALMEIHRVLKPLGYLILNDLAVPRILKGLLRPLSNKMGVYSIEDVVNFSSKLGLEVAIRENSGGFILMHHSLVFRKQMTGPLGSPS